MKLTKYLCHVLMIKDIGIHTLAYFHKDSVTSCKKIKKDYNKKDCKEIKKNSDKKDCEKNKKDCDKNEKIEKRDKKDCEKISG